MLTGRGLFHVFAAIDDVNAAGQLFEPGVAGIGTAVHIVDAGERLAGRDADARGVAEDAVNVTVVASIPFLHARYLLLQFVAQSYEWKTRHLNFAVPQCRLTRPGARVVQQGGIAVYALHDAVGGKEVVFQGKPAFGAALHEVTVLLVEELAKRARFEQDEG